MPKFQAFGIVFMLAVFGVRAQRATNGSGSTAQLLVDASDAERLVYAGGFGDGFIVAYQFIRPSGQNGAGIAGGREAVLSIGQCIQDMSGGQVYTIITNYLKAHPERWDQSRSAVVTMALSAACKERSGR